MNDARGRTTTAPGSPEAALPLLRFLPVRELLLAVALFGAPLVSSAVRADLVPVIVVDFTSSVGTNWTSRLPELIVDELVNSGEFDVLERDKLKAVVNELSFQGGALVDPGKAVQIGGMSGGELMITGNIVENRSGREQATSYGITSTITSHYLKARMEVVDLATGSKIFSQIADASAVLKSTGLNSVGEGEETLGPEVASKLIGAMLENGRIRSMIDAEDGGEAQTVSIRIESVPEGADVEIDGVYLGNTGNAFDVPPGIHEISVSLPGHDTWTKQVKVGDGMAFTANLAKTVDSRIEIQVENADVQGSADSEASPTTENAR